MSPMSISIVTNIDAPSLCQRIAKIFNMARDRFVHSSCDARLSVTGYKWGSLQGKISKENRLKKITNFKSNKLKTKSYLQSTFTIVNKVSKNNNQINMFTADRLKLCKLGLKDGNYNEAFIETSRKFKLLHDTLLDKHKLLSKPSYKQKNCTSCTKSFSTSTEGNRFVFIYPNVNKPVNLTRLDITLETTNRTSKRLQP